MDLEVAGQAPPAPAPAPGPKRPAGKVVALWAGAIALAVALGFLWLWSSGLRAKRESARVAQLKLLLEGEIPKWIEGDGPLRRRLWNEVRGVYEEHGHRLLWMNDGMPRESARLLAAALAGAPDDGLVESDYGEPEIRRGIELIRRTRLAEDQEEPRRVAGLELRLTSAFLHFVHDRAEGRLPRSALDGDWLALRDTTDLVKLARAARSTNGVRDVLEDRRDDDAYRRLREALRRYRRVQALGGWSKIPDGPALRVGDRDSRCLALRRRLARSGDIRDTTGGAVYDSTLASAVRRFQVRHGLYPSSMLMPPTLEALNVPVGARLRAIELNLERLRWLPVTLPDPILRVNIPESHLRIVENGGDSLHMVAVVGSPTDPTPVFSDVLTYLEFHPTWGVPKRILEREIVPAYKRNKHYFEDHQMRVFDTAVEIPLEVDPRDVDWERVAEDSFPFVVRQDAGPANPLGQIKFMCPNEYDVYLHDTPARRHFEMASRFLSHGCVRVQNPPALAAYLLRGARVAAPESLQAIVADSAWRQVALKRRMPVLVEYRTAWVDDDGTLQFRPDVYGLDHRLNDALRSGRLSFFEINALVHRNPRMKVTAGWTMYRDKK